MADIEIAKKSDLDAKANINHTHDISEINNLQSELYNKADINHNHDGVYQPAGNYADANHTHSYDDLTNKPTIPTKTSDLTNDSGFITGSYDNSNSGLTATDIQSAIDELKALIDGLMN